ncbi:hypothetical protein PL11201_460078 [Planktothrix sp. PCC 11201]|nr:hypothetical protein PL11201_460078 [Planktothrix sp. PCC 11201]
MKNRGVIYCATGNVLYLEATFDFGYYTFILYYFFIWLSRICK